MPQAICHAGYILGSIGTIAIGLICVYSLQILLKSHYELCRRRKVLILNINDLIGLDWISHVEKCDASQIPSMDYPVIVKNAFLEGPFSLRKFATIME